MIFFFIILFAISLIYLALTERVARFITLLVIQGILLAGIAYWHLKNIDMVHLSFILLETLVVKSIGIPVFLNYLRKRNRLNRLNESKVPTFVSILILSAGLVFGFVLSNYLHDTHIDTIFFAVAISSVIAGLFFIISHRNVFTHLIGYLVIQNGIFLMSLSVGAEMPMLINNAILLDLFISVLVLGIFINRVGDTFQNLTVDGLSQLKH
jgi:hydrogenase-4 component E